MVTSRTNSVADAKQIAPRVSRLKKKKNGDVVLYAAAFRKLASQVEQDICDWDETRGLLALFNKNGTAPVVSLSGKGGGGTAYNNEHWKDDKV